jgi:hypothetical protein
LPYENAAFDVLEERQGAMEVGARRGAHFQVVRQRDVAPQVIVELKSHEAETGSFHAGYNNNPNLKI